MGRALVRQSQPARRREPALSRGDQRYSYIAARLDMIVPKVGDEVFVTKAGYGEVVQTDVCCGPGQIVVVRFRKDGADRYVGIREILALMPAPA